MLAGRLGGVDHDHVGVRGEGAAEAETEVERDADHQRDVGLLEPRAPRPGEEQLVVGRHAATGQAVEEHRDPARLGQRPQCLLPTPPVQPGPGHDHRALGLGEERDGAIDLGAIRGRAAPRLRQRHRLGLAGLHEHLVEREVDEGRTRVRCQCSRGGDIDQAGDLGRIRRRRGELDQRAHEGNVVDLLQRALAPAELGRPAAEHEDRRVVLARGGDRAHAVGHARAGGQRAHAELAGHLGPALGGERSRLLVADVDDVDPLRPAAVVDREQVAARQREQLGHAIGAQPPGNQPATMQLGFGVGGHVDGTLTRDLTTVLRSTGKRIGGSDRGDKRGHAN